MTIDVCFDAVNLVINHEDGLKYVLGSALIVGVLGNLVNIVVFGHKRMKSPVNRILLWLSITDSLQLASIAVYTFSCGWCTYIDLFHPDYGDHSYLDESSLLYSFFLLQIFHNITVGLNIMLAFWRYLAVAYPLRREIQCNFRSVRRTVASLYALSFLSCLPILFAFSIEEDHYRSDGTGVPRYSPIPEYAIRTTFDDDNYYYFIYCVILRVVPFTLLIIVSVMLISAVVRTTRSRQRIVASETNTQQKQATMITKVIMVILLMFLITEIPMAVSGILWMMIKMEVGGVTSCKDLLTYSQHLTLFVHASYNIFCYLMLSTQYKETLRSILSDQCRWLRFSKREFTPVTQQDTRIT